MNATDGLDGSGINAQNDAAEPEPVTEAGSEPESGSDDSTGMAASVDASDDASAFDAIVEARGDAACDLRAVPSSCPNCATQNASDMPKCQMYLACFMDNGCNPGTACGSNDGVCGVNTIGGGEAPYQAAVQTYNCTCR